MNKKVFIVITMVLVVLVIIGVIVCSKNKSKKSVNYSQDYIDLKYDSVVFEFNPQNQSGTSGYSNIYYCELVNTEAMQKYCIKYTNIRENKNNEIDKIHIDVEDISKDDCIQYQKNKNEELTSVQEYLDSHIDEKYEIEIKYQRIDDIYYNMIINQSDLNIEETDDHKTEDGVCAVKHEYLLVNTEENKEIKLYYYDVAKEYEAEGEKDDIVVEISNLAEGAVDDMNKNASELHSIKELLKNVEIAKCKININYTD